MPLQQQQQPQQQQQQQQPFGLNNGQQLGYNQGKGTSVMVLSQ